MNVVAINPEPEPDGFDAFWILYVRHVAKKQAHKVWDRLSPADQTAAIIGAAAWRRVWLKRGEFDYIPHPATWLNGERWDDELPDDARPTSSAHVPFAKPESLPARGEIPEHIRQQIRRLTGKA